MAGLWRDRKALTSIGAMLICGAAAAVAYARPVSSPTLGAEWQCHHVAIITSCTRISGVAPTVQHVHVTPVDLRRV